MALFRCGSSGGTQRTALWTNPDTTVDYAGGNVQLSSDIDDFDAIEFVYNDTKGSTYTEGSAIYPVSIVKQSLNTSNCILVSIAAGKSGTYSVMRGITYVSDTELTFSPGYQVHNTGNSNGNCIPVTINGIKY